MRPLTLREYAANRKLPLGFLLFGTILLAALAVKEWTPYALLFPAAVWFFAYLSWKEQMACQDCGQWLNQSAKFCTNCGKALHD